MTFHEHPIREPNQIRQDCANKLRLIQVGSHLRAILCCILGESWTVPKLVQLRITPRGNLLGRCKGDTGFKMFLGSADDLIKIIQGVAQVAELDGDEVGYLVSKVAEIKRRG